MSLEEEITAAARDIVKDGYEMSIGELISLYKDKDLIINPDFQRFFRWGEWQKTKFIESILLGIPIPAIFVYQTEEGKWELVDGLQRLSTIFEFVGILNKPDNEGEKYPKSILTGTKLLPSLDGKKWEADAGEDEANALNSTLQREIKRARIRVEILKKESDKTAKFELFQRLNTGGSELKPQEIRNCTMVMINKGFSEWLKGLSQFAPFVESISISEIKKEKQEDIEYLLRFIVYRNIEYKGGLDVHEFLDEAMITLAESADMNYATEEKVFKDTFRIINEVMGNTAFKRYDGGRFMGQFLISSYEVVATGISWNIEEILAIDYKRFILDKVSALWTDETFKAYSGAGVRGTTRLEKLLPFAKKFFAP